MEACLRYVCNSCMKLYTSGTRYKCLICYDYDLCYICRQNGRNNVHEPTHPMQFMNEILNEGITCDWCRDMNFLGHRYKCMICKDFDLCSTCHMRVSPTDHMSSHPVQRINKITNIGISCDGCHTSNFIGRRYKCLICADFDLCVSCLMNNCNGKNNYHMPNHPMQFIDEISNEGINCDSCHKTNFEGDRYRCMICRDYDLCSPCHGTMASPQHLSNHPMECIKAISTVVETNNFDELHGCTSTRLSREFSLALASMHLGEREAEEISSLSLRRTETCVGTASPSLSTTKQTLPATSSSTKTSAACKAESTSTEDDDEDKKLCIICCERAYNTVLVPCGHMWLCFECATSVSNDNNVCPACRKTFDSFIRVYTPD